MSEKLIDQERKILDKIAELYKMVVESERLHPSELPEWTHYVHRLQEMVFYRIVAKEHPDIAYSDPGLKNYNNQVLTEENKEA